MDRKVLTCDNRGAFVALVKPLDSLEGLQVHTCSPFLFGVKMVSWFLEGYWGKLVFGLLTGNFSLNFPLLYLK